MAFGDGLWGWLRSPERQSSTRILLKASLLLLFENVYHDFYHDFYHDCYHLANDVVSSLLPLASFGYSI